MTHRNNSKRSRDDTGMLESFNGQTVQCRTAPKLLSTLANNINHSSGSSEQNEQREFVDNNEKSLEKPAVRQAELPPETVNRNKRMFGSLVGHLGLARKNLEKDSGIIGKQNSVLNAVSQKNIEEGKRLNELRQNEKKAKFLNQKRLELESLTLKWRMKQEPLAEFIYTHSFPRIAWLPMEHNDATLQLLSNRREEIEQLFADRAADDVRKLEALESRYDSNSLSHRESHNSDHRQDSGLSAAASNNDEQEVGEAPASASRSIQREDSVEEAESSEVIRGASPSSARSRSNSNEDHT